MVSEVGVSEVLGAQHIGAPRHGGSERGVCWARDILAVGTPGAQKVDGTWVSKSSRHSGWERLET